MFNPAGSDGGVSFPLTRPAKLQSLSLLAFSNVGVVNNEYFYRVGKYAKQPGTALVLMEAAGTPVGHFALGWDFMQEYYCLFLRLFLKVETIAFSLIFECYIHLHG